MRKKETRRRFLRKTIAALGSGCIVMATRNTPAQRPVVLRPARGKVARKEAMHYIKLEGREVWCRLCFRKCIIKEGERGYCRNRMNLSGKLFTLVYNLPCALQVDPIEKEPVHHMLPGTAIFCIATAGCNFRCRFCQNYHISQKKVEETINYEVTPDEIAQLAIDNYCKGVSFTYSEPTAYYEYMLDVAIAARKRGLKTICHTNGAMNSEPLLQLLEHLDAITVDLKGFNNKFYFPTCTAEVEPVLESLINIRKTNVHLEIVNLMIPNLNDDPNDFRRMCRWIRENLGTHIPLHINRFAPAYKMQDVPRTPVATLERSHRIAKEEGLEYVYIGNVPGHKYNSTFCPKCNEALIKRLHFFVRENKIAGGKCPKCGYEIYGVWS